MSARSNAKKRDSNANAQDGDEAPKVKRARPALDQWLNAPAVKRPEAFGITKPLYDRDSTFLGYAASIESSQAIQKIRQYITETANPAFRDDPANHVCYGSRVLKLKAGKDGSEESHFEVASTSDNDGEDRAGAAILSALAQAKACDVVVFVCRWFGGTMLGPRRFDDIKQVAIEALHSLRDCEARLESIKALKAVDGEIDDCLSKIAGSSSNDTPPTVSVDYEGIELQKLERLKAARTARLDILRKKLAKLGDASIPSVEREETALSS